MKVSVFFLLIYPTDFLLLHVDPFVQEAQVCEYSGLNAHSGVRMSVSFHCADERFPPVSRVAPLPSVSQRLLYRHCPGNTLCNNTLYNRDHLGYGTVGQETRMRTVMI